MKVYSYDYDFSYIPSAPFVEMTIASAFSTTPVSLNAFIDSGADATMIPFEVLQQIQAEEVETRYLRTVTGKRTVIDLYRVSVQIGPYHFPSIKVVATDSNSEIILGRDVLNQLVVTLNGLAGVTEVSQ